MHSMGTLGPVSQPAPRTIWVKGWNGRRVGGGGACGLPVEGLVDRAIQGFIEPLEGVAGELIFDLSLEHLDEVLEAVLIPELDHVLRLPGRNDVPTVRRTSPQ